MGKTNGLGLPHCCTENQQSSAKPDGMYQLMNGKQKNDLNYNEENVSSLKLIEESRHCDNNRMEWEMGI